MSIAQVDTLSDLKAVGSPSSSISDEVRFMEGLADAGDPGAGIFEWASLRTDEPNDATVVLPGHYTSSSSGRWIRQVDVRGPVHAEWFGAKGNGSTDDRVAIQACLDYFKRVTLLAKDYKINAALELKADYIIEGQAMGGDTLKLADATSSQTLTAVKNATSQHAHNAVIRDLTIDCNGESGSTSSAYQAIDLQGENILVERVEAKNFRASKTGSSDCVVIGITNSDNKTRMGIIRECVVQSAAVNQNTTSTTITCLSLLGQSAPSGSYPGRGGAVLWNRILALQFTGTSSGNYRSQLRGILFGNSVGVEIAENEIVDFDGAAIISGDNSEHDSVIRANRLLNVQAGIVVGASTGTVEHLRGRVFDNLITIGAVSAQDSAVGAYGLVGIYCLDAATDLGDYWIQRNFIQGTTQLSNVPKGIYLVRGTSPTGPILAEENIIETKDPTTSGGLNVDYENAVVLTPYVETDGRLDLKKVEVHGNRNLAGTDLRLKAITLAPAKGYWGPHSTRLARFKAPAYDGRVGLVSEEFLGEPPAFALGWTSSTSGGGAVLAQDGQVGHPGIVKLQTSSSSASSGAMLKYGEDGIMLGTSLCQVLGFGAKRTDDVSAANNYDCRMGLLRTADQQGVYFQVRYDATNDNMIIAWARNATASSSIVSDLNDKGTDRTWRDFRIEIRPAADDPENDLEARFFVNDIFVGTIPDQYIPDTVTLLAGFKVDWVAGTIVRGLLVDYFQHQVTPV